MVVSQNADQQAYPLHAIKVKIPSSSDILHKFIPKTKRKKTKRKKDSTNSSTGGSHAQCMQTSTKGQVMRVEKINKLGM